MSALLKIKDADNDRIEKLQKLLGKESKVEVLREALMLLEKEVEREKKIERYRRAAELLANDPASKEVLEDFMEGYEGPYED